MMETARYLRHADLGVDVLSARYVTHRFGVHTHDTYVVGVVVDGAARFSCRGSTHLSPSGTVMVIEPEEAHTGAAGADIGWTYRMMYPTVALMRRVAEQTACAAVAPSLGRLVIDDRVVAGALLRAQRALERPGSALAKESLLLEALGLLIERHAGVRAAASSRSERAEIARRVRDYIEDAYAEPVTLAELARLAGTSPFHLVRVVKAELGLPPHAYLNQVRVRRAKELLARGAAPADVALAVGYCDQSHLGHHFKRTVGVAPAHFARRTSARSRASSQ